VSCWLGTAVNLDITRLSDDENEELPPPDVIALEIVEDLHAALGEFAAFAEALQLVRAGLRIEEHDLDTPTGSGACSRRDEGARNLNDPIAHGVRSPPVLRRATTVRPVGSPTGAPVSGSPRR
jgi:hypothetical protein